jgi:hypothetical protein
MSGGNDGSSMQNWPYPRVAGQDKMHFALGTSLAKPAPGYFATAAGLENEQVIRDAIAGLSNDQEIDEVLIRLLRTYQLVYDYKRWRMGMKK